MDNKIENIDVGTFIVDDSYPDAVFTVTKIDPPISFSMKPYKHNEYTTEDFRYARFYDSYTPVVRRDFIYRVVFRVKLDNKEIWIPR